MNTNKWIKHLQSWAQRTFPKTDQIPSLVVIVLQVAVKR